MNDHVSRNRWLLAILAAFAMQMPQAQADIVSTEQLTAPAPADAERAKVQAFLERATVVEKLQALGVDSSATADRVGAMSQEEIHMLATRIDSLPAGGDFSTTEIVVIVLLAVLLVIIL